MLWGKTYKHIIIQCGKLKLSPEGKEIGPLPEGPERKEVTFELRAQNEEFIWQKQEGAFQALWLRKVGSGQESLMGNGKHRKCCSSTNLESGSGKKRGSDGTRSRNLVFRICTVTK